jgi:hypothetical protein
VEITLEVHVAEPSVLKVVLTVYDWSYWLVAAIAIAVAWRWPRGKRAKVVAGAVVASMCLILPGLRAYQTIEYRNKYAETKALFDKRCATAGEKIFTTVKDVEGIFLLRPRPPQLNQSNQYELDDPYGSDFRGDASVVAFLRGRNPDGTFTEKHTRGAFKFVETQDPNTKVIRRWTPVLVPRAVKEVIDIRPKAEVVKSAASKDGVTWSDLSTREDRDHWIAGSSLQVIDLEADKVIAERIGYMFDSGLGAQAGGRSPWAYAEENACPAFDKSSAGTAVKSSRGRDFVYRVLTPPLGE